MAAVAVPPSPQFVDAMANRRVPLANLQHATNSPLRAPQVGGKRQRSNASEQRDLAQGQPASKKHIIEVDDADGRRSGLVRRSGAPTTALTRKLQEARGELKAVPKHVEKTQRTTNDLEQIRQWQRHYRKLFPSFVFYFESIPEDAKYKIIRQTHILGAREVKFFSKEVTHVITARAIPRDLESSSSSTAKGFVNPQLVSKTSIFDTALQNYNKATNGDILHKAKELGMKLWTVDKLQKILDTLLNRGTDEDVHGTRQVAQQPKARQGDLQKLLENEKLNGTSDRDYSAAAQDMIPLRGYYVYVHDMDELTRPVMIREYPKVAKREDGKWPQFRISGTGKCPFVEDRDHARRQQQEEVEKARKAAAAPRTRAATATQDKRVLNENNNLARRCTAPVPSVKEESKALDPPQQIPTKRPNPDSMPPMFGSAQASLRAMPRFIGGEPIASGLQQSNITSAIRSQAISSTAAAPGARAGNSKEVNQLKRKVLEKNSVPSTNTNSGQSSTMNDVHLKAAFNQESAQPIRAAKRKAQESLGYIREDGEEGARRVTVVRRKKPVEKELKPGYCENCREKFNDFDEHVVSRKHRKFAQAADNWLELDQLLAQLVRE
ncbi:hypothetical protein DM02DRAFT_517252 [Periconia macrospinosa]|uniref:DBF4-type domain-containing protein n=1 Tax=Periconia macrospinosa TaxID=97972 RepID=A0A2V1E739_9PLEO|nr:hypothetical protein DM02DRAFT_517252 [Periconia macrospinosa]